MIKNRYFKTTQGVPFELAIGKQLATYTDIKAMVAGGVLYDLSAFVIEPDNTQPKGVATGSALSAADKKKPFFLSFVEKKDTTTNEAYISSVTPLIAETIKAELIAYKAPTKQVTTLTLSAGTINVQQILSFKVVETTPGYQPLPVWDYEQPLTNGVATAWTKIATKINTSEEGEFFTALNVGTYAAPTIGAATVVSNAVTAVAVTSGGANIVTTVVPTGTGNIPLVFSGGGGTGAAGVLRVVNGVAVDTLITAGGSGYSSAPTVTIAAQTATGVSLVITSKDETRHFKLAAVVLPTRADYNDYGVVYTAATIVPASAGSGTVEHMIELQKEANVRRGIGHYYTDKISFGTTGSEFGLPVDVVTGSGTTQWDIVVFTGTKIEPSPTPIGTHYNKHYIFVAVPAGQGAAIVAMFA